MSRVARWALLPLVGVIAIASGVLAQDPPPKPKDGAAKPGSGADAAVPRALPPSPYWRRLRRELELTQDQERRLDEISRDYSARRDPPSKKAATKEGAKLTPGEAAKDARSSLWRPASRRRPSCRPSR